MYLVPALFTILYTGCAKIKKIRRQKVKTFIIIRRSERDVNHNAHCSSREVPVTRF